MNNVLFDYPKTPRWISTEAGQWAWRERVNWRGVATLAMSVQDRSRLLQEAESLWNGENNDPIEEESGEQ